MNNSSEYVTASFDTLMNQATQEVDVLEVYYLCLQVGFQGKYRIESSH